MDNKPPTWEPSEYLKTCRARRGRLIEQLERQSNAGTINVDERFSCNLGRPISPY